MISGLFYICTCVCAGVCECECVGACPCPCAVNELIIYTEMIVDCDWSISVQLIQSGVQKSVTVQKSAQRCKNM